MKYKIVGIFNVLASSLLLLIQLGQVFIVYPKLLNMYEGLSVQLPFFTRNIYLFSGIFIIFYIVAFIVGLRLIKSQSQKLLIIGIVTLVIMLLFSGYFLAVLILSALNPIYIITQS